MKRRFSDEQIIGMIKEYESGVKAQELCRRYTPKILIVFELIPHAHKCWIDAELL